MQPIGPYQRIRRLGICQIGSIWSAVDGGQQSLVVVVLDVGIAGESRWRDAFAATTHAIAHSEAGSPLWVSADFSATTPWVAYPKDLLPTAERTFAALGMTYQPAPAEPDDPPADTEHAQQAAIPVPRQTPRAEQTPPTEQTLPTEQTPRAQTTHTPPAEATRTPPADATRSQRTEATQTQPTDATRTPLADATRSQGTEATQTRPADATRTPPAEVTRTQPADGTRTPPVDQRPPAEPTPTPRAHQTTFTDDQAPPAVAPTTPPTPPAPPTPPEPAPMPVWAVPSPARDTRPRSTSTDSKPEPKAEPEAEPESARTLEPKQSRASRWAMPVIGLVLGLVAGGGLVLLLDPGTDPPQPTPTASQSAALPAPAPASAPLSPGLEPPAPGEWPALWVRFAATDRILTLHGLDGLPFPVKVPPSWQCTSVERAAGLSRHQCGAPAGSEAALGGELVVRDCPAPCDGPRQTAMRIAEEAWGLQWVRSGPSSAYAETSSLTVDGTQRYGLVVVAYWRSDSGDIDKQVVLRMTAPVGGANQLRRVANYLRDVLIF
ncbi:hypothetical protein ACLQ29_06560 [Micromonospora sp. DT228]|uniref:hypothetical protein n=1 Tax=Micromonospora sp. DT228 TaxID=3393443 RepID=UPI003CE736A2